MLHDLVFLLNITSLQAHHAQGTRRCVLCEARQVFLARAEGLSTGRAGRGCALDRKDYPGVLRGRPCGKGTVVLAGDATRFAQYASAESTAKRFCHVSVLQYAKSYAAIIRSSKDVLLLSVAKMLHVLRTLETVRRKRILVQTGKCLLAPVARQPLLVHRGRLAAVEQQVVETEAITMRVKGTTLGTHKSRHLGQFLLLMLACWLFRFRMHRQ